MHACENVSVYSELTNVDAKHTLWSQYVRRSVDLTYVSLEERRTPI